MQNRKESELDIQSVIYRMHAHGRPRYSGPASHNYTYVQISGGRYVQLIFIYFICLRTRFSFHYGCMLMLGKLPLFEQLSELKFPYEEVFVEAQFGSHLDQSWANFWI